MKKNLLLIFFSVCSIVSYSQKYSFTGNGVWEAITNWSNNMIPPATLPAGDTIYINPVQDGVCVLNTPQFIAAGGVFIVAPGAKFIVLGFMSINAVVPTVTTVAASAITSGTAVSGGRIVHNGGSPVTAKGIVWATNQNPTTALATKIIDTGVLTDFTDTIKGLLPSTQYYARAYATNAVGTAYGNQISFTTKADAPNIGAITIGNQAWTYKNLNVTSYRNGNVIPQVTDATAWANLTTGAWCYYKNDASNDGNYGKLYNWYAVTDPRGLAPAGWHIASDSEWTAMIDFLGGAGVAGGKMKAVSSLWVSPNTGANNSSGFTALPANLRDEDGVFPEIDFPPLPSTGYFTRWWSTSKYSSVSARDFAVSYNNERVIADDNYFATGNAVRIIQNKNEVLPVVFTDSITGITQRYATPKGRLISEGGTPVYSLGLCWNITGNPKLTDSKVLFNTTDKGSFENIIKNLNPGNTYYVRAFAVNGAGIAYGNEVSFKTLTDIEGVFHDPRDGKNYTYKSIGTQVWMTQNLNYSKSDSIGVCYDSTSGNCDKYGRLYDWYTAQTVAPPGWHIPSPLEWATLQNFLPGDRTEVSNDFGHLKAVSNLWFTPKDTADNSTGFSGLPGGYIISDGIFTEISKGGYWWSSERGAYFFLSYMNGPFPLQFDYPGTGMSVRCIKDN